MSATPVPTKLVFLHELAELPAEEKVRFLGCVTKYDVPTGMLTLKHHYPVDSLKPAKTAVDMNLLLGSIKSTDIEIGAWINVFGYVTWSTHANKARVAGVEKKSEKALLRRSLVKALMIYSAGSIDVGKYEKAVAGSRDARKSLALCD